MPPMAQQTSQSPRDQRTESLNRVISMLLQGLALQNFCSDDEEFEAFQRKVRKLREEISKIDDEDTGLLVVGSSARPPN